MEHRYILHNWPIRMRHRSHKLYQSKLHWQMRNIIMIDDRPMNAFLFYLAPPPATIVQIRPFLFKIVN
jgi:hypothetical protein